MSNCINNLYDYDFVKKRRVCKNLLLKSNFHKIKTKKDGYRSDWTSCCKECYYNNRDRLPNKMKKYNKENRKEINIYEKN